jgi:hypothetical protein
MFIPYLLYIYFLVSLLRYLVLIMPRKKLTEEEKILNKFRKFCEKNDIPIIADNNNRIAFLFYQDGVSSAQLFVSNNRFEFIRIMREGHDDPKDINDEEYKSFSKTGAHKQEISSYNSYFKDIGTIIKRDVDRLKYIIDSYKHAEMLNVQIKNKHYGKDVFIKAHDKIIKHCEKSFLNIIFIDNSVIVDNGNIKFSKKFLGDYQEMESFVFKSLDELIKIKDILEYFQSNLRKFVNRKISRIDKKYLNITESFDKECSIVLDFKIKSENITSDELYEEDLSKVCYVNKTVSFFSIYKDEFYIFDSCLNIKYKDCISIKEHLLDIMKDIASNKIEIFKKDCETGKIFTQYKKLENKFSLVKKKAEILNSYINE